MSLQPIIFPIDQPVMPEARQIGRTSSIGRLETRLKSPAHQWMIGERRIGKTSVAKAVLARLRRGGSVALDVDLSRLGLSSPEHLAGDIARQAQAAGVGNGSAAGKAFSIAKRKRTQLTGLGKVLEELGFSGEGEALTAVSSILAAADDGAPGLDTILGALSLHARVTRRRAYLLLDEVHLLAQLDRAEERIAKRCREDGSPIVFIFAGSEESSARALREEGRPLASIGEEFKLSEIAWEEWMPGLRERFAEAELKIEDAELQAILTASGGHPRRTMLVCSRVRTTAEAQPDRRATATLVKFAIDEAEGDRSWR